MGGIERPLGSGASATTGDTFWPSVISVLMFRATLSPLESPSATSMISPRSRAILIGLEAHASVRAHDGDVRPIHQEQERAGRDSDRRVEHRGSGR